MDKLKFALFTLVTLSLLGLLNYWAVVTIQSGSEHVSVEKAEKLQNENEELIKEVEGLKNELALLQPEEKVENNNAANEGIQNKIETKSSVAGTIYKNQDLINELQKLMDSNAVLKLKSSGSKVGTIQKFLNIYNKASNKIDNDFGESTKNMVIQFQKDQGLSPDGEAGKTTFSKMIDWLKKQG